MMNSVIAGGTIGFVLAARQGIPVAMVSGAIGALLLALIEGGALVMNRFGTEMLKARIVFLFANCSTMTMNYITPFLNLRNSDMTSGFLFSTRILGNA